MHYFNEIVWLLNSKNYKQFNTKNDNKYIFRKCLYDLSEICIEEKDEKYILSVPSSKTIDQYDQPIDPFVHELK